MGPMIPQGREAIDAWRALNPQARDVAWVAARRGAAAPDAGLGMVAAGYGKTIAQRLLVARVVSPFVFIVVIAVAIVALVASGVPTQLTTAFTPVCVVGYLAGAITLRVQRRRFMSLHNSGLLAVEAAHLSPNGLAQPDGRPNLYQSEFTVPYDAAPTHAGAYGGVAAGYGAPLGNPPAGYAPPGYGYAGPGYAAPGQVSGYPPPAYQIPGQPPAPLAAPGTAMPQAPVEILARRNQILLSLGLLTLVSVCLWSRLGLYLSVPTVSRGIVSVAAAFTLAYTVLIVLVLVPNVRLLIKPVVARFSPTGWELPAAGMSGGWGQIREIRIRTARSGRGVWFATTATGTRVVALIVDDPQRYLDEASPFRRFGRRSAMRRYGSPVVILASPRRTVGVVPLTKTLQQYTNAPLNWA